VGSEAGQKTIRWIVFPTNALALLVQTELKLDPHSGITVVFRSKRGDRLKILVWD
jgi:transposase